MHDKHTEEELENRNTINSQRKIQLVITLSLTKDDLESKQIKKKKPKTRRTRNIQKSKKVQKFGAL